MQASYMATLQNLNDWEGNIENIENDALQTFVDLDFAGAVTEFNEAFESLLDKSSDNISKISRHLLLMLVDPGRNPIDDPILFVPGTAEYRDAYSAHLRKFLQQASVESIDIAKITEDDYFELFDANERMQADL